MRAQMIAALVVIATVPNVVGAHGGLPHASKSDIVIKQQKPWGMPGTAQSVKRTIELEMRDDMRFIPDSIAVRQGETIRFLARNHGKLIHEFVIGTKEEFKKHAVLMAKFPRMKHTEPFMTHVSPSKAGELIWTFNRPGEFDFACLIAGHYEAGMAGKITVATR